MKNIISAICISAAIFVTACGNDNSDKNYPSNSDTGNNYSDTPSHSINGYAPPNQDTTNKTSDSLK